MIGGMRTFTQGRDGSDSNNYFYKNLFDNFGALDNQNFDVKVFIYKNTHKLLENAVLPIGAIKGEISFTKIQMNKDFSANLITGNGNDLFISS